MPSIDLNSDLGENVAERIVSDDESMLRLVTSANVSCGFHAGSPEGIRETLAAAVQGGVGGAAGRGVGPAFGEGAAHAENDPVRTEAARRAISWAVCCILHVSSAGSRIT